MHFNLKDADLGWFNDKVCRCSMYKYSPEPPDFHTPPTCRDCGLLDRAYVTPCRGCDQLFYNWFSHPKRGFYHKANHDPLGWFCYSCLEHADHKLGGNTIVSVNLQKIRIPPVESVIPPDYRHAAKVELPTEVQDRLDDFLARLKRLSGCPQPKVSSEQS